MSKFFKLVIPCFLLVYFSAIPYSSYARALQSPVSIENLQVEYTSTPLGIDVKAPRFSWQMVAPVGERDFRQQKYEILVLDAAGKEVWKAGASGQNSLAIVYEGSPLQPVTRYTWAVKVWDNRGEISMASSWFETGLMNPDPKLSAWSGATWIGGSANNRVLYSHYLAVFQLSCSLKILPGSTRASLIMAANDSRLMDKNKNIFQVRDKRNESYFKLEMDISGISRNGGNALLKLYRAGYTDTDTASRPLKVFSIAKEYVNQLNKNAAHTFSIKDEYGELSIELDGSHQVYNLNPMGTGHDVLPFGMLCDLGFSVDPGQNASFSALKVSNTRTPRSVLFNEDLSTPAYSGIFAGFMKENPGFRVQQGAYQLRGGTKGLMAIADPSHLSMPMLRTRFVTPERKVLSARIYVTARGIYELYLNGARVGDDYYNPGLSQYNITQFYQTYDVTEKIRPGANALGAMLGEGWWSGLLSFGSIWNHFGDRQSLLAKLVIRFEDGSQQVITSNDHDWTYSSAGPVIYSSLYMGEVQDARKEAGMEGWSLASYDDSHWQKAVSIPLEGTTYTGGDKDYKGVRDTFNFDKLAITGQIGANAGIYKTLDAVSMKEVRPGVYVYNLGQNIVGVPRITLPDGKEGQKMTLRFAEMLYPDLKESGKNVGMLMTENYRAALSQDKYILKDGPQVFQPHFTSHGFQYVEITGLDHSLPVSAVQGISMSSVKTLTASYESSDKKVNKLWSNLVWSNVDNFMSIPTDCPQRNERMGWSGDISVFSRTATYLSNSDQFLNRHMLAMRDVQSAAGKFTDIAPVGGGFGGLLWGSAGITVPWEAYLQYKDKGLLEEHYEAMSRYMTFIQSTINAETGLSTENTLGDWLGQQNNQLGTDYLVTAYHVYDLGIMARVAAILNKEADAQMYRRHYEERKAFFNKTFVNADKKTMGLLGGNGFGLPKTTEKAALKIADTQTSYAVGLALGVFSAENIPYMVKNLNASVGRENKDDAGLVRPVNSLMTGFIGTAWISKALSDHGSTGLAYKLIENDKFPSWLYAVDQGATTIWERLNGYTVENGFGGNNGMNSFNHYSFGAIGQWMIAYSAGIQRDEPGFQKFILQPQPDPTGGITWARGTYDSPYGKISSGWEVIGGKLAYHATVPANTQAIVYLPSSSPKGILEGGKPVKDSKGIRFLRYEHGNAVYELRSGNYSFSSIL